MTEPHPDEPGAERPAEPYQPTGGHDRPDPSAGGPPPGHSPPQPGRPPAGYPPPGQPGHPPAGYPPPGQPGYPPAGYPPPGQPGYPPPGQAGYPPPGYPGYPQPGYAPPAKPRSYAPPDDPLISADYAGWWHRTTGLIRAAWRPLVTLYGAAAVLQFIVLGTINGVLATRNDNTFNGGGISGYLVPVLAVGGGLGGLALLVVQLLVSLGTVYLIVAAATGGPLTWQDALRTTGRRGLPLIGWGILAGLSVLVGLVLCVLPGIYLIAVFTLLVPVVVVERTNAYTRCFQLFHADFGAALARVATILAIGLLVNGVAGTPLRIVQGFTGSAPVWLVVLGSVVGVLVQVVVSVAVSLVTASLATTAYADLRARKEPVTAITIAHGVAGR